MITWTPCSLVNIGLLQEGEVSGLGVSVATLGSDEDIHVGRAEVMQVRGLHALSGGG